ncbi:GNAT family N-acetyltransferase [Flavobacterium sp. DG1-102-2]|uniref:GNAT family N-acetyltransferase n=1 Tax=Flavobacterium sp. DG1-102-2 TaxID=3081663 RepID=UPI00294A8679|nr:GNAT family N-acetyltransferase [Flavobacterium sp. DG1-102-2]MDV6170291.1 GNAT family N-acetyltransferase [Flavobacterium sp. DG1-102-2]
MKNNGDSNFKVNEEGSQFELHVPGGIAFVEYYREGEKIFLTHTETPEQLRGKGIAGRLIERTLQCIKDNGLTLVPLCSFVANYINEHDEWNDILSEGYQM